MVCRASSKVYAFPGLMASCEGWADVKIQVFALDGQLTNHGHVSDVELKQ